VEIQIRLAVGRDAKLRLRADSHYRRRVDLAAASAASANPAGATTAPRSHRRRPSRRRRGRTSAPLPTSPLPDAGPSLPSVGPSMATTDRPCQATGTSLPVPAPASLPVTAGPSAPSAGASVLAPPSPFNTADSLGSCRCRPRRRSGWPSCTSRWCTGGAANLVNSAEQRWVAFAGTRARGFGRKLAHSDAVHDHTTVALGAITNLHALLVAAAEIATERIVAVTVDIAGAAEIELLAAA